MVSPSAIKSSTLNTAACLYIVFYIYLLTEAVECYPLAYLYLSKYWIDFSPAPCFNSGYGWPILNYSAIVLDDALPKTTISNNELAPNLFAPWTDAQAVSPAAKRPGINLSLPSLSIVNT